MAINGVEQFRGLEELLKNRKRVVMEETTLEYREDFNDPNDTSWSSNKVKYTVIEYIYTNPQFNRMFAHLEDGRNVDYDLSFMDIFWNHFIEYVPAQPPKKKMTLDEIEKELGYEIEVIE